MSGRLRLGVNIDHVATVRNARGIRHPEPLRAARLAIAAGADGITAHLREDRRHIVDADIAQLMTLDRPLNLEMAATDELAAIALGHRPHAVCIVPERRAERTTEGGLDVIAGTKVLSDMVPKLAAAGIRVSLFVNPDRAQLDAARAVGAPVVELHTGAYCDAPTPAERAAELKRITEAAAYGSGVGLEIHAGHGLAYDTVGPIAALPEIAELNIGHFLIGEAIFIGLEAAIRRMRELMDAARRGDGRARPA